MPRHRFTDGHQPLAHMRRTGAGMGGDQAVQVLVGFVGADAEDEVLSRPIGRLKIVGGRVDDSDPRRRDPKPLEDVGAGILGVGDNATGASGAEAGEQSVK